MPEREPQVLERIISAMRADATNGVSLGQRVSTYESLARSAMRVVGERDADIRQHLTFEPGDCKCETCMQLAIDGALVLLGGPTDTQEDA